MPNVIRRGIYNVEYFSGAQVSLYIGDIWVDEITTLSYGYTQSRQPIYGYASTLYDDLSEGQILVQGQFTINFKEAGYLWLILNRFRGSYGGSSLMDEAKPFTSSASTNRNTVERLVNNELSIYDRNRTLQELAEQYSNLNADQLVNKLNKYVDKQRLTASRSLGGFASNTRTTGGIGRAENVYEAFEDAVWGKAKKKGEEPNRRPDDPALNPFEIYVTFGDFAGDNTVNHTIERMKNVSILGKSKQIVIDGMPIQEQYTFIARELV